MPQHGNTEMPTRPSTKSRAELCPEQGQFRHLTLQNMQHLLEGYPRACISVTMNNTATFSSLSDGQCLDANHLQTGRKMLRQPKAQKRPTEDWDVEILSVAVKIHSTFDRNTLIIFCLDHFSLSIVNSPTPLHHFHLSIKYEAQSQEPLRSRDACSLSKCCL
jgi:hypothetical protein